MFSNLKKQVRRIVSPQLFRPVIGEHPEGGPSSSPITVAIVCGPGFNINVPNASKAIRLGFCRGFAQIGVRYRLVSVYELAKVLPELLRPIVFLSCYDYENIGTAAQKVVKRLPHFIWLPPWFKAMERVFAEHELPVIHLPRKVTRRILDSGAAFGWAPVPPSCLTFYEEWQNLGLRVSSIPLACDTSRYYPEPTAHQYSDVDMAFVGGFRSYKNRQYDKYLKPYEDILTLYGYDRWPYKGYRGLLPDAEERVLYQNARRCPALSEPHAELMGDICERAFKIMGSGGLAITDATPFYRELFAADELLVPSSVAEYHHMMQQALTDPNFNQRYRQKGYEAILARHTYAHRARAILTSLKISAAAPLGVPAQ